MRLRGTPARDAISRRPVEQVSSARLCTRAQARVRCSSRPGSERCSMHGSMSSNKRRRAALAPRSGPSARGLPSPRRADGTHGYVHEQPRGRRRRSSSGHADRRNRRRRPMRVARGVRRRPRQSLALCVSRSAADSGTRRHRVVPALEVQDGLRISRGSFRGYCRSTRFPPGLRWAKRLPRRTTSHGYLFSDQTYGLQAPQQRGLVRA